MSELYDRFGSVLDSELMKLSGCSPNPDPDHDRAHIVATYIDTIFQSIKDGNPIIKRASVFRQICRKWVDCYA